MRSKRERRRWAIVQVRVGVASRRVVGRVVQDCLPAGLRLDVLRFDTRGFVRTWFRAVDRVTFVPEHEARRAALPRAARPCAAFAHARGLPAYCAACGHDARAHAEAQALRVLGCTRRRARFRWANSLLTEIEVARRIGQVRAGPAERPIVLFGGFDFASVEAWRRLAAAGLPLVMPFEQAYRAYEERILAAICDRQARVTTTIAQILAIDPADVDILWEPRPGLADELRARVEAVVVGGTRLDAQTWQQLADADVLAHVLKSGVRAC
jgi:hypothetical protein